MLGQTLLDRTGPARESAAAPLRPMRVLVVSDQELWVRSLDSTLGPHGFSVLGVPSAREAIDAIALTRPDLLLIQSTLRDGTGLELCGRLRAESIIDPVTPVVLLTAGPCSREVRLSALRAGAWECYSFPLDPEILVLKLHVYANAKRNAEQAREESHVDEVTGLYSTIGTLRRATELALHARRYGRALACTVFAPTTPGEEPIRPDDARRIAQVLRSAGRNSDVIGRLSQNEFVVFAPDTDGEGIEALAGRMILAVEAVAAARLQAGCYGVANLAEIGVEPVDMVVRATLSLTARRNGEAVPALDPPRVSPEVP